VLQALLESMQKLLVLPYGSEEPDHRHRLLRAMAEPATALMKSRRRIACPRA